MTLAALLAASAFAGAGTSGFTGDGAAATLAQLNQHQKLVAAPDGSVYVMDGGNARIRRILTDGLIHTTCPKSLAVDANSVIHLADIPGRANPTYSYQRHHFHLAQLRSAGPASR
ncbi:MAG: hypothetical protein ACRERX_05580 [Pseudomonas sp.]